ncbi:WXG100 family type VII secretion target [Nocardioides sp. DS6]|uniref:ESAT-6-like protein n=1 Tax=Nocardioides eburneus TaxID=3231482 RepID=A0ABV3SZV5_9ACTN
MNDYILVKHSSMDSARDAIKTAVNNLENHLNNMESDLKVLSDWQGDAQQAFETVKKQWHEVFQTMRLALAQHGQLVQDAQDGYNDADKKAQSYFEGI